MLAKKYCGTGEKVTLQMHTNDLLEVAESLKKCFPFLPSISKIENFWELLRLAIIFHDIGKATLGFQELMSCTRAIYPFRHEWLSCSVFLNISIENHDKILVANAILSHHKDFKELQKRLKQSEVAKKDFENGEDINLKEELFFESEFSSLDVDWIKSFLSEYGIELKRIEPINPLPKLTKEWIKIDPNIDKTTKFQNIFLSASLSICDHNASAGINKILILEESDFRFLDKYTPKNHQKECWESNEDLLLIAPTGSGKTESAIGWIKNQIKKEQSRIFYVLPFTASINAMTKRMIENFQDDKLVGLLHGKAKFFIDEEYEKQEGQTLKELIDTHKKINRPFKIVTPYQILKWAFGVKGFEKGLTELAGSCIVFDEIHIYDKEIFQRIIFFLKWLKENLGIKVFIMTATMPTFLQDIIVKELDIKKSIKADHNLLRNLVRHKIKILNGGIDVQKEFVKDLLRNGKSVIIVCNTVAKAQEIYKNIDFEDKLLLHSRFNAKDRTKKEQNLYVENKPKLLIGTQAIEVSLDIDYDVIITEPAPLDSLLQRFGRVFRKRKFDEHLPPNCYITNIIENSFARIYEDSVLKKTLFELEKIDNQIVDESIIQKMLDAVYEPFDINRDLEDSFFNMMDSLFPFNIYEDNEEEFEKQFDGVQVLPHCCLEEFSRYKESKQYLEAEKLFVPISKSQFVNFKKKNLINIDKNEKINIIRLKYSNEMGLMADIEDDSYFS